VFLLLVLVPAIRESSQPTKEDIAHLDGLCPDFESVEVLQNARQSPITNWPLGESRVLGMCRCGRADFLPEANDKSDYIFRTMNDNKQCTGDRDASRIPVTCASFVASHCSQDAVSFVVRLSAYQPIPS
jgi:hypothetical protein